MKGFNNHNRCPWVDLSKPDYVEYHDKEWGVPVHDDRVIFEFLTLEAAQAGLSWYTVLRKREHYRAAFDNFDAEKMARYSPKKLESLMQNAGIVRNRLKIEASVSNAQAYLAIPDFSEYLWGFIDGKPVQNQRRSMADIPGKTPLAEQVSKDLLKRGFRFVGPTIVYAFMQACGLVNDHLVDCHRHEAVKHAARRP